MPMSHRLAEAPKRRQSYHLHVVDLKRPGPKRVATIELEAESLADAMKTVRSWYSRTPGRYDVRSGR